jgi:hypothetical protein
MIILISDAQAHLSQGSSPAVYRRSSLTAGMTDKLARGALHEALADTKRLTTHEALAAPDQSTLQTSDPDAIELLSRPSLE